MLENDARAKLCPFKMAAGNAGVGFNCETTDCMAWEQWTDPVRDPKTHKITGHKPQDPPQGHCGMVPPELNCPMA